MSHLLISEPPLMVLPSLATKIGLNEAIFLQQLHYWLLKSKNIEEGYAWVYNSYPQWQEQFPFWCYDTIKRTIHSLEKQNLIITGCFNSLKIDKTKWYRINYAHEIFHDGVKATTMSANCTDHHPNLPSPIPETTTETTTKLLNCSSQNDERQKEAFNRFWEAYPRKVGKAKAWTSFKYKDLTKKIDEILKDIGDRKELAPPNGWLGQETVYIPHPTTYLNQERWNDEYIEPGKFK